MTSLKRSRAEQLEEDNQRALKQRRMSMLMDNFVQAAMPIVIAFCNGDYVVVKTIRRVCRLWYTESKHSQAWLRQVTGHLPLYRGVPDRLPTDTALIQSLTVRDVGKRIDWDSLFTQLPNLRTLKLVDMGSASLAEFGRAFPSSIIALHIAYVDQPWDSDPTRDIAGLTPARVAENASITELVVESEDNVQFLRAWAHALLPKLQLLCIRYPDLDDLEYIINRLNPEMTQHAEPDAIRFEQPKTITAGTV